MANKVYGSFDETSIANANTTVDDLIDAAFAIGTPTELVIDLVVNIRGDDGSGNEWTYDAKIYARNYHASTVNTTLKTNLDSWWTELEDVVTDSGKYSTVERVWGNVTVEAIE